MASNLQTQAGQQFVQSQQPNGYGPPVQQFTGVPAQGAMPAQVLPQQQQVGYQQYSIDHLPPPPQRGGQQPGYQGNMPGYGLSPQPYQGQPGVAGGQVQQPAWQPQQPGQQPVQQQNYGLQQQPPQQQYPPQFQQPGQAPQGQPGTAQLNPNTILDGPNVPPELRGRTWAQAMQLYNGMATNFRQQTAPQTPAGQTQQQMQQTHGLQPQFGGQPAQQADPRTFFQNPQQHIAEVVRQQIEQTVMPALAPVVRQSQDNAVMQAQQIAAQGIPDFQGLLPDIMQTLASAPPGAAADPQVWVAAARMARGRQMEEGRYRAPQQQAPRLPGQQAGGPGYAQPAGQPQAPVYSYFSESPTAPSAYGQGQGPAQPTQKDYENAAKFGTDINSWMAWKVGVPQGGGL